MWTCLFLATWIKTHRLEWHRWTLSPLEYWRLSVCVLGKVSFYQWKSIKLTLFLFIGFIMFCCLFACQELSQRSVSDSKSSMLCYLSRIWIVLSGSLNIYNAWKCFSVCESSRPLGDKSLEKRCQRKKGVYVQILWVGCGLWTSV